MELRAWVYTEEQLRQALGCKNITSIYTPMELAGTCKEQHRNIILLPPEYLGNCEEKVERQLIRLRELGFENALAHTVGHISLLHNIGYKIHGGNRLNCTNSGTMRFLAEKGLCDIILSPELTVQRINRLEKPITTGFIAYGRLPLMLCRRCPINDGKPCGKPNCGKTITDRKGNKLPVICNENCVEVLNSDTLILGDRIADFRTDFAVLRFTTENDMIPIISDYMHNRETANIKMTRGLYYRGVL